MSLEPTAPSDRFGFTLPIGHVDAQGRVRRQGVLRRARAADELAVMSEHRHALEATVALLGRVLVSLEDLEAPGEAAIAELYSRDFDHLLDLFARINGTRPSLFEAVCPTCDTRFLLEAEG